MQIQTEKFSKACMPCHSTPENDPAELIALYGNKRSFNKKIGDNPYVLSLRIPMEKVYSNINALTLILSIFISGILVIIFFIQWFLVKRSIIAPINIITVKSTAIANDESLLGDRITITGRYELAEMANAFSDMSEKLAKSKDNLEILVEERTRQLRKSKEQAQRYLNVAAVMFVALNRSGEITIINQKGCDILGISEEEAIGLNWVDNFLPQRMMEEAKEVFNQLMQDKIDNVEYSENHVLTRSGEERLIAFHNSPLNDSTVEISGILWSGEDVTEKHQIQEEKEKLEAQLRQSYKMEALGTLAGGIAHDFNNILAAILGFAEMAFDDIPDYSPAKYQIKQVLKAGNRAKDLVKYILTFSRKEARERIPVKSDLIITETLKLLRASKPTTVEIRQNIDLACGNIMAEPTQIHQILMNLCTNAAQNMDEEGGILHVELTNVELGIDDFLNEPSLKPGAYIQLSVKCSGTGIHEKHIERIFAPYFTTKEIGKGSGMGLAVVIGIVRSHKGMIRVESELGKGTTFFVFLPRIEGEPQEKIKDSASIPIGIENILVVDDEESMIDITAMRLERLGYQVTAKISSKNALELFRSQPDAFDLVITDQTMPELTGEQLAKELMKIRPNIPIILSTGFSSKVDSEKAKKIGIKAFIIKPVDIKKLAKTVRQVLDN